jgi:alkaline phosphatase
MSRSKRFVAVLGGIGVIAVLGFAVPFAVGGSNGTHGSKAKNVILFIGDGMGDSEVTSGRYYQYGAAGRLNVDKLPITGFQTTWSVKPAANAPYKPDYAPDSASTGTMWATGEKTIDERISQGPSSGEKVPGKNLVTILEKAQKAGKKTGNVSTAEITDATPAVLNSHISLRGCQGPTDTDTTCPTESKKAGGLGSIAEQTVDHKVDVVLGGGRNRFAQKITGGPGTGKSVEEYAQQSKGYTEVNDAAGLAAAKRSDRPLLGLFAPINMTTEWTGPQATLGEGTPAQKCVTTNRPADQPSLTAMTKKAIDLLEGDRNGFFLQVEGASIDKQDHAANACGQIGETIEFDNAIAVAQAYARKHPDTLILVTADHAHTSQIVAEDSNASGTTPNNSPTGYSNNLITADDQVMRITYGTAGGAARPTPPPSQQHTGTVVPIWGQGPNAWGVSGTTDHTDLFDLITDSFGRGGHH